MVSSNKPTWRRIPFPRFYEDFQRLTPYGKWVVGKTLDAMVLKKNPAAIYQNTICDDSVPDLRLFGIQDDGLGNKRLGLLIYIDAERHILCPVAVYNVRPASHTG